MRAAVTLVLILTLSTAALAQPYRQAEAQTLALARDEETTMKTSKIIADRLDDAHVVLNIDRPSGTLSEETGEPLYWSWQGAEKTYIDFQLEVTNPGGHSAMPRADNAIAHVSRALERISTYRFTPELNDIARDYFAKASAIHSNPEIAAAMRTFAADPTDERRGHLWRRCRFGACPFDDSVSRTKEVPS